MDINETLELADRGLHRHNPERDPSAYYIDPDALRLMAYLPGAHGDDVTAWWRGNLLATAKLDRAGAAPGYAIFDRPAGSSMIVFDPVARRVIFI